jgi:hypothetical protein
VLQAPIAATAKHIITRLNIVYTLRLSGNAEFCQIRKTT